MRGEYVRVDIIQKDSNQLEIDKEANQTKIVQVGQNNSIKDLQFTQTIM
jgi:hypothetical protein